MVEERETRARDLGKLALAPPPQNTVQIMRERRDADGNGNQRRRLGSEQFNIRVTMGTMRYEEV